MLFCEFWCTFDQKKIELYFVIQIENQSSLDYDVNFLNLSVTTRQKGKKKSMQSLRKDPVFAYKAPTKIKKGHTDRLVYVFPKFSLSNDRQVLLELNEGKGERDVVLKISHRFINNPNWKSADYTKSGFSDRPLYIF